MTKRKKSPNNSEFLTVGQVASLMQVREVTVRLWLQRKLLRGVKIGHGWRVHRSAIEEYSQGKNS